jgi:hypothetical protein
MQTRIHKTHHAPDLGEATTFPLIILFASLHGSHIQMAFCPGTPKWESWLPNGSPEIPIVRTLVTLGVHNFACKPLIVLRFEAKL